MAARRESTGLRATRTGGLDHRTIARLLGISHGTVQNIARRALAKMRRAAEREGVEVEDLWELLRQ